MGCSSDQLLRTAGTSAKNAHALNHSATPTNCRDGELHIIFIIKSCTAEVEPMMPKRGNIEEREQFKVIRVPPLSAHAQSEFFVLVPALFPGEGSILHTHTPCVD